MQDPHFFRFVEFGKCVQDLQIPCRWAPDAGLGYGEPVFNFYGQLPYAAGEVFHLVGFSQINSLKALFILSLVGSAVSMFILSQSLWKSNLSAFVSSTLYVYAPYRAVDVWVRGALPEALAFVLFPLILWRINTFIQKEKKTDLLWISLLLAFLILTHNLSLVLFLPVLLIWVPYKLWETGKWNLAGKLGATALFVAFISAFYILPTIFEARYVTLEATTRGYFDFRGHFTSLSQLFISRAWGYGASVFGPEDGLSLSVGHLQWIVPLLIFLIVVIKSKLGAYKNFIILVTIGWFCLFLTHNKSTFLWESTSGLAYIQFPWRFLATSVFSFSLAAGVLPTLVPKFKRVITLAILVLAIAINYSFFKEDIWYSVGDSGLTTGERWEEQTRMSIGDFWPKFGGAIPTKPAPESSEWGKLLGKGSNFAKYEIFKGGEIEFPIAYFPGWKASTGAESIDVYVGKNGLISTQLPEGEQTVTLSFRNTPVRTWGNIVSLTSLLLLGVFYWKFRKK